MKRVLWAVLILAACRSSDGNARTPGGGRAAGSEDTPASPGAARADSLLSRADASRIQGATNAPVWLVEISDFQCPFCKRWHEEVYPSLKREYIDRGIVRMAYVHLPLNIHPNAPAAAEASLCAGLQDRFWPMHDKLFQTQERWAALPDPQPVFDSLAVASGADAAAWRDCMSGDLMQRVINGDRARAANVGVRSTPTFFVGDEPIEGAAPIETFRQAIERARARPARSPSP